MIPCFPISYECKLDFKKAEAHCYLDSSKTPGGDQKPLCHLAYSWINSKKKYYLP